MVGTRVEVGVGLDTGAVTAGREIAEWLGTRDQKSATPSPTTNARKTRTMPGFQAREAHHPFGAGTVSGFSIMCFHEKGHNALRFLTLEARDWELGGATVAGCATEALGP